MKKLLIILISFFSTIFFIDNVNANEIYVTSDYRNDFYLPDKFNDLGDYENNYNRAYEYYLNNCLGIYDSYYISKNGYGYGYGSNQVDLLCFNSSNNQITPGVRFGYYSSRKYMFYMTFQLYYSDDNDYSLNYFYNDDASYTNVTTNMKYGPMAQGIYGWFDIRDGELKSNNGIISTNIDFPLVNNSNTPIADSVTEIQAININDTIYNLGDLIYNDGSLVSSEILPEISIKKESETTVTIDDETYISSVSLDIDFSIIDNDKYLYMYKYGFNSDWSTITLSNSNSFTKTFNTNDTLYVQILDKITQEIVSSATYTIDSINYNFEPYVDVVETIPNACSFYKNGRSYTICKELNISAKNLKDGNYIASYSYDNINWTNFVNTTISLNENKTFYFKIVNYLTNEVSYRSTYTVGNIDTDISELGVFNTYSSTYDKDTSFITAYINIYNLVEPVQDNYKIYYSFNSTSFIDITLLLADMTNYYQYEINNINENKTIYFKITDLNDNILYTSTYDINYQIQANENSNFFTNFRTNFHGLSDIISTPLYAIKKLNTGVCTPLELPIPYTDKNISLPCMTTIYQKNIPDIFNIWQIVTNGIISYYIILDLFRIVKSFKEPEEDKIEVIDL